MILNIRPFQTADKDRVIDLWHRCNLVVPWNDPEKDIAAKCRAQPELFFVGTVDDRIVATAMAGYDGHRGWVYYLAVDPDCQRRGFGRQMMARVEQDLKAMGCIKINLQVRATNPSVIAFYERIGFSGDDVMSLGKKCGQRPKCQTNGLDTRSSETLIRG